MSLQDGSGSGSLLASLGLFDPPPTAPTAVTLKFNKDNVLQVGHILRTAVDEARAKVQDLASYMQVRPCGEDIVSKEAAKAWNERLTGGAESYAERLLTYVQSVSDLADQLKETAKQYGYTDEEITNAFKSIEVKSV